MAYFWCLDAKFLRLCDAMYDDYAPEVSHLASHGSSGVLGFSLADAKFVSRPMVKTACTRYAFTPKIWTVF